ncbi:hypothetical protein EKO29_03460 [Colwellia sp. Arc7-635]|uniref:hypothetical protein n=1 Tax=Colwellia sp. Arc7-635 TaxID=2497879 RepID=UPI000F8540BB|nr:hypothetical protein [Colwellia sp. Arc7-635]AZQ83196.1 hypothetical protein EKO29_03460 [Colwellia sp. Arc7-635]
MKIQDSASRERVSTKALIEVNGCSIVEINNAGDDPFSPCPKGAKLENQPCVAALDKGMPLSSCCALIRFPSLTLKLHLQVVWVYKSYL